MGGEGGKWAFVTVGTTKFDALIAAMDSLVVADELAVQGFSKLIMQVGNGSYRVQNLFEAGKGDGATQSMLANGLTVETFQYAPNLHKLMAGADLVISHAGAGSLFEALRLRRPLLAVPNPLLMDNHQAELAQHLEGMGHCATAMPDTLLEALQNFDASKLLPYEAGDAQGIVAAIDRHMSQ